MTVGSESGTIKVTGFCRVSGEGSVYFSRASLLLWSRLIPLDITMFFFFWSFILFFLSFLDSTTGALARLNAACETMTKNRTIQLNGKFFFFFYLLLADKTVFIVFKSTHPSLHFFLFHSNFIRLNHLKENFILLKRMNDIHKNSHIPVHVKYEMALRDCSINGCN